MIVCRFKEPNCTAATDRVCSIFIYMDFFFFCFIPTEIKISLWFSLSPVCLSAGVCSGLYYFTSIGFFFFFFALINVHISRTDQPRQIKIKRSNYLYGIPYMFFSNRFRTFCACFFQFAVHSFHSSCLNF